MRQWVGKTCNFGSRCTEGRASLANFVKRVGRGTAHGNHGVRVYMVCLEMARGAFPSVPPWFRSTGFSPISSLGPSLSSPGASSTPSLWNVARLDGFRPACAWHHTTSMEGWVQSSGSSPQLLSNLPRLSINQATPCRTLPADLAPHRLQGGRGEAASLVGRSPRDAEDVRCPPANPSAIPFVLHGTVPFLRVPRLLSTLPVEDSILRSPRSSSASGSSGIPVGCWFGGGAPCHT